MSERSGFDQRHLGNQIQRPHSQSNNVNAISEWLPFYRDQLSAALPALIPARTAAKRQTEMPAII